MKYSVETNALAIGYGKAALARHRVDIALLLQRLISPLDGVRIDGQRRGQLPHRGQLIPRRNGPRHHQPAQSVPHLLIDGPGVPIVQIQHTTSSLLPQVPQRGGTVRLYELY